MLTLMALAAAVTSLAAPPISGRMHDVSGNPGLIETWSDKECLSSFRLKLGTSEGLVWRVNWSLVEAITVETESGFESDPAADLYKTRTGLVVKGVGAFKTDLGGRTIEADSFEYFLATPAEAERLQNIWTRQAAACLSG